MAKDQAKYVFGTSIESFEEEDNSVAVRFIDGRTDRLNLVVGADGSGSQDRKRMVGPDAGDTFVPFECVYVAYFTILRPVQEEEEYLATFYMAPGRRMVKTRRQIPHAIKVCIGYTDTERLKSTREDASEEKKALVEIFQSVGWETGEIQIP